MGKAKEIIFPLTMIALFFSVAALAEDVNKLICVATIAIFATIAWICADKTNVTSLRW